MSKARILVVDDDEGIRQSLSLILKKRGYLAEACACGKDAVTKLRSSPYDVLLTDLRMPEMGGIELLKAARKLYPSMGAIIMTGFGEISTYLEAMDLGAAEYINKPVKSEELELIIKKLMAKQKIDA
ncbi:MAG: response regulator [Proteobacteria bacterium]|nr:response regulator [Pseudomonadota bacterium]